MSLLQLEVLGMKRDFVSPTVLQPPMLLPSTPTQARSCLRIATVRARVNVQAHPWLILKMFKMKTGRNGPSVPESAEEGTRSEWNPAIRPIRDATEHIRLLSVLATLKDAQEIGAVGPHGLHVTDTTKREGAECALDQVVSAAEKPSVQYVLQDQDLKRLTVTDGVLGQIGKENVRQARKECGSVQELALLKSATDLIEKQDSVADPTLFRLFPFPPRCLSMLLWELASAVSFSGLLLELLLSSTSSSTNVPVVHTVEVLTMSLPSLKTSTSLSQCWIWNTSIWAPIRVIVGRSALTPRSAPRRAGAPSTAQMGSTVTTKQLLLRGATVIETRAW